MKDFKKYYLIPAPPEEVYQALTTEATIRLWTGDEVEFIAMPNTEFSMWDGSIVGRNISFEKGKQIVQEWFFGDENADAPSIVTLKLHHDKKGTSLEVRHTNIPDEAYEEIADGWTESYIADLIDFYTEE
ncbi:MAG: SRPBCC domain-containing protein [Bacteroidia bacterium]|nr:SRPBCC domain-containing protein [Bacteroidia bacterium]MCZ2140975.1 SRPBCC domain-containing protein [Bacteroidia bacterium]